MNLDPGLEKAKAYQRKKYLFGLAHVGMEFILLVLVFSTGLAVTFRDWAQAVSENFYSQLTAYYGFFFVYLWLFDIGFGFYSGFRLEHAFGLSNQTLGGWATEFLKKSLLTFVFSLVLIWGLYFVIRRFANTWWVGAWLGFAGISYLLGQLFPLLVIPLFYRYSRVGDEGLKNRVFRMVSRFGLPLENVYSLNLSKTTKKANAMFTGLGQTKRLVLADTLIQNFTTGEIESVVAHELGHYVHRDIWHHLGFNLVVSFFGFAGASWMLRELAPRLGYAGSGDLAAFPLLYLIFFLFGILMTPASHAYSRWREREADRFALKVAGPEGFVAAMEKLGRLNLADPDPHPLIVWWFYTHPPIARRIRMARDFQ